MPGPREWSPRGFKKYTIIGIWAGGSYPWVEFSEGTSPGRAVRAALEELRHDNEWDDETLKDLFVVEILPGHHQGLLKNERALSAYKILTGKSGEL